MRTSVTRALLLVLVVGMIVAPAAQAFAAAAVPPKAAPGVMDVQVWPNAEPNREVTVVSVTVPDAAKLPLTIRVPIPPNSQVLWAGEILGGDPSKDPARKYKIVPAAGGSVAEFVMEKARTAQIETVGGQVLQNAGVYSIETSWVQSTPARLTGLSVRMPAGAAEVSITPKPSGTPDRNTTGETLYPLLSKPFKLGETATVTASWTIVPVAAQSNPSNPGATNPIPILVGLVAAAVVVLAVVLFRQRGTKPGGSDEEDALDEDVDDGEDDDTADAEDDAPADDEDDSEPFSVDD